jgi:riboflavin kinase/FMN adenylyltransferase
VVNVGVAPTVRDGTRLQVEAHVLDGSYELYGQRIAVAFSSWLREERKMSGLEELREAIAQDIERVRETAAVLGADLQLLTI